MEVLQTPGAGLGCWKFLGDLLSAGSPQFLFRSELGQAREVKTALSGLIGRFVARAYLTRYFGYRHFKSIGKPPKRLNFRPAAWVIRRPGHSGDLPDWVVSTASRTPTFAIVEAKGSHDPRGPGAALSRAWEQAQRADVTTHSGLVPLKRFAIATRWGVEVHR